MPPTPHLPPSNFRAGLFIAGEVIAAVVLFCFSLAFWPIALVWVIGAKANDRARSAPWYLREIWPLIVMGILCCWLPLIGLAAMVWRPSMFVPTVYVAAALLFFLVVWHLLKGEPR